MQSIQQKKREQDGRDAMLQSATEQAHEAGGEMRIGNCTGLHTDLTSDFLKLNLFFLRIEVERRVVAKRRTFRHTGANGTSQRAGDPIPGRSSTETCLGSQGRVSVGALCILSTSPGAL